ncbi:MAG: D-aminoacylase [Candidatus Aminicenantes bacterium]|nr:D-aminoacylase [Candidatus Aminicenantes bacterium]
MRLKKILIIGLFNFCLLSLLLVCSRVEKTYDLVIANGLVIDGSGNPWFKADIGIKGQKIIAIKDRIEPQKAERVIEAAGLIVAPGFIDIHTHADEGILKIPGCENYISQGVTTLIGGNCGGHEFPLSELFQKIQQQGIACNFGSLAGHNTIREKVMGMKMGEPTPEEMSRMKELLRQEMRAGALGLSTGLAYLPGTYSRTEELVELASVVAEFGGFYASHIRNQGKRITQAIEEAISIGEKNHLPVEISHIKLADEDVWNQLEMIIRPVEQARARGVEVTLDQYPYTATSSGFTSSFPQDVFEGGQEKFLERLKDPETYDRVKQTIINNRLTSKRGINKLETIYIARSQKFPDYEGKNLKQILEMMGKAATVDNGAELIIDIVKEGDASAIFFQMDEKDVEALMKLPYVMIGSDGSLQVRGQGSPHPRSYGTFPRVLGEYVRNRQVITLEEAIRKMTSLPAQTLRIKNRGLLREGMYADITIFDPKKIKDLATFASPHQYSQGLVYVLVNGQEVIEQGKFTGKKPGMIIYGQGYRKK